MIGQGCDANGEGRDGCERPSCGRCYPRALVPYSKGAPAPDAPLARGYQPAGSSDEVILWLQQRVAHLERELAGAEDRYVKLEGIYNRLADQWNAFQATARPDNRNCQRAEASGELARKLAEVFLAMAYGKKISEIEEKLLGSVLWKASGEAP